MFPSQSATFFIQVRQFTSLEKNNRRISNFNPLINLIVPIHILTKRQKIDEFQLKEKSEKLQTFIIRK